VEGCRGLPEGQGDERGGIVLECGGVRVHPFLSFFSFLFLLFFYFFTSLPQRVVRFNFSLTRNSLCQGWRRRVLLPANSFHPSRAGMLTLFCLNGETIDRIWCHPLYLHRNPCTTHRAMGVQCGALNVYFPWPTALIPWLRSIGFSWFLGYLHIW